MTPPLSGAKKSPLMVPELVTPPAKAETVTDEFSAAAVPPTMMPAAEAAIRPLIGDAGVERPERHGTASHRYAADENAVARRGDRAGIADAAREGRDDGTCAGAEAADEHPVRNPAAIVPKLLMPPENVDRLAETKMPFTTAAEIVPALVMPPRKFVISETTMPVLVAAMVPELTMPPPALAEPNCATLLREMPAGPAVIVPPFEMPPASVVTTLTSMP